MMSSWKMTRTTTWCVCGSHVASTCVCASRCVCRSPLGVHVRGGGLRAGRGPGEPILPVQRAQGDQPSRRHRQLREGATDTCPAYLTVCLCLPTLLACIAWSPPNTFVSLLLLHQVLELEEAKGEWGFKALKQIMKLHFRLVRTHPHCATPTL